ncbi:MAG: flagellar biosynthetic protein FliR [Actinomycetota bacterium]
MTFAVDPGLIVSFLLAMTRVVTVLTVAPPFRGSTMPVRVRVAIAASVGFLVGPRVEADVPIEVVPLIAALVYQVVVGALFGFVIQLLLSVPLVAGSMIDGLSGLSASSLFDPMADSAATPAARLNQLLASMILIGIGGHLLIMRGIIRSYEAAPLSGLRLSDLDTLMSEGAGQLLLAAVEISFPLLVALLMTETVLALAARAAPRLNVMVVGFAVKGFVFLLAFGLTVPLLINGVSVLLTRSLRWALAGVGA